MSDERLPLIGRERVMIENLTKALRQTARGIGDYTEVKEMQRGNWFEIRLDDGRVARVMVELHRIEREGEPPSRPSLHPDHDRT